MTPAFAEAARRILAPAREGDPVAAHAADQFEQLAHRLARLVGDLGVRTLFERSLAVASAQHPWLASARASSARPTDHAWTLLREVLAAREPAVALDAAVILLATLVALLERLIGEPLVAHLLDDLWPATFGSTKGTP